RCGLRPDPATEASVHQLKTKFGLEHLGGLNPFRLSGGEKRRRSVAAGLLAAKHGEAPTGLLADAPTFRLDRASTTSVLNVLADYAETGGAVVIITHDQRLAQAWATRILTVAEGALV